MCPPPVVSVTVQGREPAYSDAAEALSGPSQPHGQPHRSSCPRLSQPPIQADTASRASLFVTLARLAVVGVYWRPIAGGLIAAVIVTDTCPRSG